MRVPQIRTNRSGTRPAETVGQVHQIPVSSVCPQPTCNQATGALSYHVASVPITFRRNPILLTILALASVAVVLLSVAWIRIAGHRPSNERNWSPDQAVLPWSEVRVPIVRVHNIRNFGYLDEHRWLPSYYDATFDLRELQSVWFIVEPFGSFKGPAHTFVSFGFRGNRFLSISAEIRKEEGETFSPLKGAMRQYELMYVVGDERDLIKLRTNYRHDQVFLYPVKTTPIKMRRMFLSMIERANALRQHPEFYNTFNNTCTTNIVSHVNSLTPNRVPFSFAVLLPGYSDRLALKLGLIDTSLSIDEAHARFRIDEKARACGECSDFSLAIRR